MNHKPWLTLILALGLTLGLLGLLRLAPVRATTFTVSKLTDTNEGLCNADCSLREAIIAANTDIQPDTINLGAGVYTLSLSGSNEDQAATGDLDINRLLTLTGLGSDMTIIDATGLNDRVFHIRDLAATVVISGVTIQGRTLIGSGGGILNTSNSNLTLLNTSIRNNTATGTFGEGGGIHLSSGNITLNGGQIFSNTARYGGGIFVASGIATLNEAQILNNTVQVHGGGLYLASGSVIFQSGKFLDNIALAGGGVHVSGGTFR